MSAPHWPGWELVVASMAGEPQPGWVAVYSTEAGTGSPVAWRRPLPRVDMFMGGPMDGVTAPHTEAGAKAWAQPGTLATYTRAPTLDHDNDGQHVLAWIHTTNGDATP